MQYSKVSLGVPAPPFENHWPTAVWSVLLLLEPPVTSTPPSTSPNPTETTAPERHLPALCLHSAQKTKNKARGHRRFDLQLFIDTWTNIYLNLCWGGCKGTSWSVWETGTSRSCHCFSWIHVINSIFSFVELIIYFITRAKVRFLLSLKLILLYLCLCVNSRFHDKDWRHFFMSFFLSILINQQEVVGSFSSLLKKPWCSSHWMMCSYIFRPSEVKDVTIYDNNSEPWRTVTSSFTLLVHR